MAMDRHYGICDRKLHESRAQRRVCAELCILSSNIDLMNHRFLRLQHHHLVDVESTEGMLSPFKVISQENIRSLSNLTYHIPTHRAGGGRTKDSSETVKQCNTLICHHFHFQVVDRLPQLDGFQYVGPEKARKLKDRGLM